MWEKCKKKEEIKDLKRKGKRVKKMVENKELIIIKNKIKKGW